MSRSETESSAVSRLGAKSGNAMMLIVVFLAFVVAVVAWARLTEQPLIAEPDPSPITAERVLHIAAKLDGAAHVTDQHGEIVAAFGSGKAVFISTIARVIAREREKIDADLDAPIYLRRRGDVRLTIFDPETQRETELSSFGKDNVAAFSALLVANTE